MIGRNGGREYAEICTIPKKLIRYYELVMFPSDLDWIEVKEENVVTHCPWEMW